MQPAPVETVNLLVAMAGLSIHTQRAYVRHLKRYLSTALHPAPVDLTSLPTASALAALTPIRLRTYLNTLKTSGLSANTISQARTAILWLAGFVADLHRDQVGLPGALRRVRVPAAEVGQRGLKWLTAEEVKAILLAVPKVKKLTPVAVVRNLGIVTLIATTGLRREEVAAALWEDLVKMGGYWCLTVHGKGERIRHVKLPGLALDALNAWQDRHPLPDGDRAIFSRLWKGGVVTTTALSAKKIWEIVEEAARAAGIDGISPHVLRRTFARGAFEHGASFELIRQTLGHEFTSTTERYVNAALELDRAATDVVAEGLEGED